MRIDIADPKDIETLRQAEEELRATWLAGETEKLDAAADRLAQCVSRIYPTPSYAKVRENLEILVVALVVAMAFRTYFVQPFKIPTGSMQPTLYGIQIREQRGRSIMDMFPLVLVRLILFGERYVEVPAKTSGQIFELPPQGDEFQYFEIRGPGGRTIQRIRAGMPRYFEPGQYVAKGQLLASGQVVRGDHIFVDKIRYNFMRPRRGDIFVFSTDNIPYDRIKKNSFYIKRLAGLPGETLAIDPPFLVVDGEPVTSPYPFRRILEEEGYSGGYMLVGNLRRRALLRTRADSVALGPDEYFPLGDNTSQSLDGRFFGGVPEENVVGPAFMVYWPISWRWGYVR